MTAQTASAAPNAKGSAKLAGHLAALGFAILIAGSFSIGDRAASHIGPAALNALRFALATAVMAGVVLALTGGRLPSRPAAGWRFAVLGGLFATYFIAMFIGLRITDPVSIVAVFTLVPLMSAGFGYLFLGHVPSVVVMTSLIVAGAGAIWVIFDGDAKAIAAFEIGPGELIFFIGCICHAAYTPLTRRFRRDEPATTFALFTLVGTTLWLLVVGTPELVATSITTLPLIVWLAIGYLAVFTTAGTTFLIQYAALRLPASKAMAYSYLTPVIVILIEGLTGQGWATLSVGAGAVVTACALLIVAFASDG